MDKEHRDELRENDLMEFLRNFKAWFNQYGTQVLLVILIVVLGYFGARWFTTKDARMRENGWSQLAASAGPQRMAQVATEYPAMPGLGAYALLEAADLLRRQALLGVGQADETPVAPAELAEPQREDLQQAAEYYQRIIGMAEAPLVFKLNAHLGLAVTHLSLGDREAAREHYRQARSNAGPFQNIATLASRRLVALDALPTRIALANKPPQAEQPDTPEAPTNNDANGAAHGAPEAADEADGASTADDEATETPGDEATDSASSDGQAGAAPPGDEAAPSAP